MLYILDWNHSNAFSFRLLGFISFLIFFFFSCLSSFLCLSAFRCLLHAHSELLFSHLFLFFHTISLSCLLLEGKKKRINYFANLIWTLRIFCWSERLNWIILCFYSSEHSISGIINISQSHAEIMRSVALANAIINKSKKHPQFAENYYLHFLRLSKYTLQKSTHILC